MTRFAAASIAAPYRLATTGTSAAAPVLTG
jgi:hypothetical protein